MAKRVTAKKVTAKKVTAKKVTAKKVRAKRVRMGGPRGVKRPYSILPPTDVPTEQIAQALDHMALSLSAIDHNIALLAQALGTIADRQGGRR